MSELNNKQRGFLHYERESFVELETLRAENEMLRNGITAYESVLDELLERRKYITNNRRLDATNTAINLLRKAKQALESEV